MDGFFSSAKSKLHAILWNWRKKLLQIFQRSKKSIDYFCYFMVDPKRKSKWEQKMSWLKWEQQKNGFMTAYVFSIFLCSSLFFIVFCVVSIERLKLCSDLEEHYSASTKTAVIFFQFLLHTFRNSHMKWTP